MKYIVSIEYNLRKHGEDRGVERWKEEWVKNGGRCGSSHLFRKDFRL